MIILAKIILTKIIKVSAFLFPYTKWNWFMFSLVSMIQVFTYDKVKGVLLDKVGTDEYILVVSIISILSAIILICVFFDIFVGLAKMSLFKEKFSRKKFFTSFLRMGFYLLMLFLLGSFQLITVLAGWGLMTATFLFFQFLIMGLFCSYEIESIGNNMEILTGKSFRPLKLITLLSRSLERLTKNKLNNLPLCDDIPEDEKNDNKFED